MKSWLLLASILASCYHCCNCASGGTKGIASRAESTGNRTDGSASLYTQEVQISEAGLSRLIQPVHQLNQLVQPSYKYKNRRLTQQEAGQHEEDPLNAGESQPSEHQEKSEPSPGGSSASSLPTPQSYDDEDASSTPSSQQDDSSSPSSPSPDPPVATGSQSFEGHEDSGYAHEEAPKSPPPLPQSSSKLSSERVNPPPPPPLPPPPDPPVAAEFQPSEEQWGYSSGGPPASASPPPAPLSSSKPSLEQYNLLPPPSPLPPAPDPPEAAQSAQTSEEEQSEYALGGPPASLSPPLQSEFPPFLAQVNLPPPALPTLPLPAGNAAGPSGAAESANSQSSEQLEQQEVLGSPPGGLLASPPPLQSFSATSSGRVNPSLPTLAASPTLSMGRGF